MVNDNGVSLAKQSNATLSLTALDEPVEFMGLDEVRRKEAFIIVLGLCVIL